MRALATGSSDLMPDNLIGNPLLRPYTEKVMSQGACREGSASDEARGRLPVSWTQPGNNPEWNSSDREGDREGAWPICSTSAFTTCGTWFLIAGGTEGVSEAINFRVSYARFNEPYSD